MLGRLLGAAAAFSAAGAQTMLPGSFDADACSVGFFATNATLLLQHHVTPSRKAPGRAITMAETGTAHGFGARNLGSAVSGTAGARALATERPSPRPASTASASKDHLLPAAAQVKQEVRKARRRDDSIIDTVLNVGIIVLILLIGLFFYWGGTWQQLESDPRAALRSTALRAQDEAQREYQQSQNGQNGQYTRRVQEACAC
mmetsp:Transcript_18045/g.38526  ORF Transcript_18045/g.38526 Transcript_18045/m.38526 type:complete len:202 (-) Transcript_18045:94-699(-)